MKKIYLAIVALSFFTTFTQSQSVVGIGISGAYLSPTGDFGDVYKDGWGGFASLNFNLSDNFQLSLTSGYSQFQFNNDRYNQLLNDFFNFFGISTYVNITSSLRIIPVMLGGKYFFTNTPFRPYAEADLGIDVVSVDGATIIIDSQSINAATGESKIYSAWSAGAGFMYQISKSVNLDVNAKFNGNNLSAGTNFSTSIGSSTSSESSNSSVTFWSVNAGFLFEL